MKSLPVRSIWPPPQLPRPPEDGDCLDTWYRWDKDVNFVNIVNIVSIVNIVNICQHCQHLSTLLSDDGDCLDLWCRWQGLVECHEKEKIRVTCLKFVPKKWQEESWHPIINKLKPDLKTCFLGPTDRRKDPTSFSKTRLLVSFFLGTFEFWLQRNLLVTFFGA